MKSILSTHWPSLLLAFSSLSACSSTPKQPPQSIDELPITAHYKENSQWKVAQPTPLNPQDPWWTVYQDNTLNLLMNTLISNNLSIAQAEVQYRQAQALLTQAQASLFPTVGVNTSATKAHEQGNASNPRNTYNFGLSSNWEIDLWGNIRHAIESSQVQLQAEEATLNAVKLSAQASFVNTYLALRVLDQQIEHKHQTVTLLQETQRITQHQYKAGLVTQADVALAESTLKTAEVSLASAQLSRDQLEHALAVLLGQAPARFNLAPTPNIHPNLPSIPAGVPSTLLERRPDIVKAEHLMAQANANIGIARAAYFPTLTLNASSAYKGSSFVDWFSLPNRIWSIGPSLALSVFDAGLRHAKTEQAIAAYDQAVLNYRSTILNALQSVEDNLVTQGRLLEQAALQEQALHAAQQAEHIVLNQYQAGTVAYLQVLNAQNTRLTAENNAWNIRNQQYASSVALIIALGGRW